MGLNRVCKEWKKRLIGKKSNVLEVRKGRDKMRFAKNHAALGLAKEIKTNSNRFLSYINKIRLEAVVQQGPTERSKMMYVWIHY